MKKISDKGRRILRMIYQGLGAAAVSLVFQACYGTPMDMEITIRGEVRSEKENKPIPEIQVSVENLSSRYSTSTDIDGAFYIGVPERDSYELTFKDNDGPANGGDFVTGTKTISYNEASVPLKITLKLDAE